MSNEENRQDSKVNLNTSASNAEESEQQLSQQQKISSQQLFRKSNTKIEVRSSKILLDEKLSSKMFTYARETICFFLAIAFTALAALHSSPPRISKPPIARPFFNESSLVLDYYKGHLGALIDRVTDFDFCFVMYYAPWDAESQIVKEEFEKVAQYYNSQVFFAAINCWHPGSECRARYSKIQSYPVLMMYPAKESGIQYKGVRSAPYMIRFIHNFMNPIIRVSKDDEIMELLKSYDAVMIGYFRFDGISRSPGYREFYRAALRNLERDPNGEVAFVAVINKDLIEDHGVMKFPSASLLMWNETLFYPDTSKWTSDNINNWISSSLHRVVTWIQPPGSKSLTFAPYLWDGPVLFLFTPRNPLHFDNDNYNLLREIGLQYYDCVGNPQINDTVSRLRESRNAAAQRAFKRREYCTGLLDEEEQQQQRQQLHQESILAQRVARRERSWSNITVECCTGTPTNRCVSCTKKQPLPRDESQAVCAAPGALACRSLDVFGAELPLILDERPTATYARPGSFEGDNEDNNSCSANESCDERSSDTGNDEEEVERIDPRSAASVQKAHEREECRRFLAGYSYRRPVFPRDEDDAAADSKEEEVQLTKDRCHVNKTLALVAIDSLHYFHFSEGLGIELGDKSDKTALVILDPMDESQYVLQDDFGRNTLARFINNYTHGYLRRTLRSNNPQRFIRTPATKQQCESDGQSRVCVEELSTETFLKTILNPDKDVVVMYHSPYCGFCSAVAYVYLTVAHYLAKMDHLEFVRIDGDNNDLPWEYTMTRYPSILFFPARRKEDSTLFPWKLPISVGNLLNFVLANLDAESHVEALINVCAATGGSSDCVERVRWLCLDVIEEHLREFRQLRRLDQYRRGVVSGEPNNSRKKILLLKLALIREVHLELQTCKKLDKDTHMVGVLRSKFRTFYRKIEKLRQNRKTTNSTSSNEEKEQKSL
ncbi:thioredoxin domain-containing protein 11 [Trichogramma pretiosum]|uniref:thioredoxin domain-containing protein 11 n=1 Tax=Trichogramma pretiosum TaxID=7493 RepID=UPI0006C9B46F|nr:thioredoxin domain-containing protein 11 [Trichogramma pretiosum]XP_014234026.1 thioredoxin domain-containing protein 11 [Trichogramma pretiosum]XP_014234027.1 thioredoxin domain-containing protein 11 [Trichogramma pretiosum]